MDDKIQEEEYLSSTLELVNRKLKILKQSIEKLVGVFNESNDEYFDYLKANSNKIGEESVVELVQMQGRLDDLQADSIDFIHQEKVLTKMLDKPYFSSINIKDKSEKNIEKYYIGINSLVDDEKTFKVVDWRSPIASIFYDYEQGDCQIKTNSSILHCELLNKRQYGISQGVLNYFFDSNINIEDEILKSALGQNTSNQMKSIVQTIQKEQNEIIRADENKNLIVQGVAGSGKTAVALHRIAYLIYKMKGKIKSENIVFLSPNNAFSSYISSVLPDLAEEDIEKVQLDLLAKKYLKKYLILEPRFEQLERIITLGESNDYLYKTSNQFLVDLLEYANKTYIESFHLDSLSIRDIEIDVNKIHELFFGRYSDRDLFTRLRWIAENIFSIYFYKIKKPETIVKLKELIFMKLYAAIDNKNCVKAYINFLKSKGMKLELVGDKVKNEDAYGILFFKMFIYGLDKFDNIKHLVVDEMQDYTSLQMYIINYLYSCTKTILGDCNQSVNPNNANENLCNVANIIDGDSLLINLHKSYRSTIEIANFYNSICKYNFSEVVSRHGDNVEFINTNSSDSYKIVIKLINEYKSRGFNSIAIILKTNTLVKKFYKKLSTLDSQISLIDDNIDCYDNKVCVISAYNSKGLEFDGVIIIDSDSMYSSESDRNILYIASTRALHKLSIVSIDTPSEFIKEVKEKL